MPVWKPSRRAVLAVLGVGAAAGGAGLWLAAGKLRDRRWSRAVSRSQPFAPSVFVAVDPKGMTTVWVPRSEMGQGVLTALPMLVAEELDADWSKVRVEQAPADASHDYGPLFTAASASVRSMFDELRRAGAAARAMLVAAAADRWSVAASRCRTRAGVVEHPATGRKAGYGELAEEAADARVPLRVRLKTPDQFRLIGNALPRLDVPAKVTGQARFGLDARRPGMLYAVVARPPTWGAKLASPSWTTRARAPSPASSQVVTIEGGVAVVADSSWAALQGRDALDVQWTGGLAPALSDADIARTLAERAGKPGAVAHATGDAAAELARELGTARRCRPRYSLPYLAHVPMEPLNCLAEVPRDGAAAARCGRRPRIPTAPGRPPPGWPASRWPASPCTPPCWAAASAGAPSPTRWPRRWSCRRRPGARSRCCGRARTTSATTASARPRCTGWTGALDAAGTPIAWSHHLVSPSIGGVDSDGGQVDSIATDGATDWPYAIPHVRVQWSSVDLPVPVGDLALGRLLVQHLRGREFPGRAGPRRRPGPAGPAPPAAGGRAPPARLRGPGRPARRLGTAARRRPRPGPGRQRLLRQLRRPGGRGVAGSRPAARASTGSGSPPTAAWW